MWVDRVHIAGFMTALVDISTVCYFKKGLKNLIKAGYLISITGPNCDLVGLEDDSASVGCSQKISETNLLRWFTGKTL